MDLQPWLCLDSTCPPICFTKKDFWIHHLANFHSYAPEWKSVSCLLCQDDIAAGKPAITRHLSSHLEEISLAALPAYADSESDFASNAEEQSIEQFISEGSQPNDPDTATFPQPPEIPSILPAEYQADVYESPNYTPLTGSQLKIRHELPDRGSADAEEIPPTVKTRRIRKELEKKFKCPEKGCGKAYSRAEHL
jgi:hypothetical protein